MTLVIGQFISLTLLGINAIILMRLLLPSEYGLYAIAVIPYGLLTPLRDMGVPFAIQHKLSLPIDERGMLSQDLIMTGFFWEFLVGFAFALMLFLSSGALSSILGFSTLAIILIASTPCLATMGVVRVTYGVSIATGRPGAGSILMVIASGSKLLLSVGLVLLGGGALGAMIGFAGSAVFSALLCVAIVGLTRGRISDRQDGPVAPLTERLFNTARNVLGYGTPIGVTDFITLLASHLILIIAAANMSSQEFGVLNSAYVLYVYVYAMFIPVMLILLTVYSGLGVDGNKSAVAYMRGTHLSALLAGSMGVALSISSTPVIRILLGSEYSAASLILFSLSLYLIIFPAFGGFSSGMLLLGQGKSRRYLVSGLTAAAMGTAVGLLVIPEYGSLGVVLALGVTLATSTALLFLSVRREIGYSLDTRKSLRLVVILLASVVVGLGLNGITSSFGFYQSWLVSLIVTSIVAFLALTLTHTFTEDDAKYLSLALEPFPVLAGLGRFLTSLVHILSPTKQASGEGSKRIQ